MNITFYTTRPTSVGVLEDKLKKYLDEKFPQAVYELLADYPVFREQLARSVRDIIFYDSVGIEPETVRQNLTELRGLFPKCVLVILAGDAEYAVFGYGVKVFDYLVEPLEKDALTKAMDMIVREHFHTMLNEFSVRIKGVWIRLSVNHIRYMETVNHHIVFYMDDGRVFKRMGNFRDVETELFCNTLLFRCHKSYVVNSLFVEAMKQGSFILKGGKTISISRPYRKAARRFYAQSVIRKDS